MTNIMDAKLMPLIGAIMILASIILLSVVVSGFSKRVRKKNHTELHIN